MRTLDLKCGAAQLTLAPQAGGAIANLSYKRRPILRPCPDPENAGCEDMASIILTPFSNRVAGQGFEFGGFEYDGKSYALPQTLPGEPLPIHGDGFSKPWRVADHSEASADLELTNGNIGPWRYTARQDFILSEDSLLIDLSLTNTGPTPLPFGFGFHPWFPKDNSTRLSFNAGGYWENGPQHCSKSYHDILSGHQYDFTAPRSLPDTVINNAFTHWAGEAVISQGSDYVSVRLSASDNLSTAIIYCPGREADFFCFEPVSHPINSINMPGRPGLKVLHPQDSLRARMRLSWDT